MNGTRSMMRWKCQDISSCSAVNTLPLHAHADTSETWLGAISTCQATYMTTSTCIVDMRRQSARRDLHAWRGGPCVPPLISMQRFPLHTISTYKRAVCWYGSVVVYQGKHVQTSEHPIWQLTSVNIVSKNKCPNAQMLHLFALQSPAD